MNTQKEIRRCWKYDDFEHICKLGVGAFGVVNKVKLKAKKETEKTTEKAFYPLTKDTEYAMKIIKNIILNKEEFKIKVFNEISNIIDHENVCKLYGYFTNNTESTYYLIFELYEKSLYYYAYLDKDVLSFDQKIEILLQSARALKELHNNDILHLDIKLENFLLFKSLQESHQLPVIKLIDFGFSHKLVPDEIKKLDFPKGTIDYMSPEMFGDEIIIMKATDCWSFGVLIYDFINGYAPFADECIRTTKMNIYEINWDKNINSYLYPLLENIFVKDFNKRWTMNSIYEYLFAINNDLKTLKDT